MGGWPAGGLSVVRPSSTRTPSQNGSTPAVRQPSSPRTLVKSPSTSFLQNKMTAAVLTPPSSGLYREFDGMNTIPDPRTPSPGNVSRTGSNASEHHPDLSNEVATLSTKLINAINHQTNLDDSLQSARHELESAKKRIAQLEAANNEHETSMQQGLLVKAEDVRKREQGWTTELDEEKRLRAGAEKAKKAMELELENLTTALFEEANTMVASARKETEASERKNDQLKQQIQDMELLLASHQEQLQDLKVVMEKMSSDRADDNTNTHVSSVPSTPGVAVHDRMSRMLDSVAAIHAATGNEEVPPDHPLHFSHLIRPVLRTDLDGFEELRSVLTASRAPATAPQSRAASGSFSGISLASLTGGPASSSHQNSPTSATNASSSVIGSSPAKESLPALKDTKLYKRALAEDINPTLLLESAPGLSWLARRTVPNALTNNSLLIEPLPPPKSRFYGPVFACALCGENRKADAYKRKHQFRTSDAEDAQRYPLCDYCLGRVRACCDYVGFLRLVRDGLWRAETEDDIKGAWEEAVRLRERMFWARVGGGVVPAMVSVRSEGTRSPEALRKSSIESVGPKEEKKSVEDPFTERASASIDSRTISRPASRADTTTPIPTETVAQQAAHELVEAVKHNIEVTTETKPEVAEPTIVEPALKLDESVDTAEGARSPDNSASAFATPLEEQKQLGMPGAF